MSKYVLKNVFLGIGMGLVLASMVNISAGSRPLSADEIKKEAEKHGLIVLNKEELLNIRQEEQSSEEPSPNPGPTAAPQPPAATPTATPTPTPTPAASTKNPDQEVTISVKSGMSSERVAELLRDGGLIKDTRGFLNRLGELDKDDKLKVGDFTIPMGTSTEDIIKILAW